MTLLSFVHCFVMLTEIPWGGGGTTHAGAGKGDWEMQRTNKLQERPRAYLAGFCFTFSGIFMPYGV